MADEKHDYVFLNGCDGGLLPGYSRDPWTESGLSEEEATWLARAYAEKYPSFLVSAFRLEEVVAVQASDGGFVNRFGLPIPSLGSSNAAARAPVSHFELGVAECKRRIETLIALTSREAVDEGDHATVEGMRMALRCLETA